MIRTLVLPALLALAATACSASEAAPAAPAPQPEAAATTTDLVPLCIQAMQRARTCTDPYIAALVDARAAVDQPAGIADAVKADRDGVIAQAKAEWATDSRDENISQMCAKLHASATPAQQAQAPQMEACLAQSSCQAYVDCAMPIMTSHLQH